jgi:hypothetical protein
MVLEQTGLQSLRPNGNVIPFPRQTEMLPQPEPEPVHKKDTGLQIVTASVNLTIDLNGEKLVLDINRLMREPYWSISLWDKPEGEVTLTRDDDAQEDDFAKFHLTIQKAVDG